MTQMGRTAIGTAPLLSGIRDEIRAKINITDVVGQQVQLRKAGKAFVGLCPFHHEKTPSFHVDPQKGVYHCFGCHEGGDLFDFVMKVEGLSFPEAIEYLAEKTGIELPRGQDDKEAQQRRQQIAALAQVNLLAQAFFARALNGPGGKAAREYLGKRGLQPATVRRFGIGLAPDTWDALTKHLKDAGMLQPGIAAGLLVAKGQDGAYDRFRGRVMFPLSDPAGKVAAFGGRTLAGAEPKYLNSPESLLYVKRRMLYGLPQAKDAIRRHGRALIVEGYFDCIALHQVGIDNAVASCGTALTPEHLQLLRRVAREIYLCFDGDEAGRSAAVRGLDALQGAELPVRVVLLPKGHDPDTFVQGEGTDAFLGLLEKALPLTDYLLENAVRQADLRNVEGRMRGVRAALPILKRIQSTVERDAYIQRVAVRLGLPTQSLSAEVAGAHRDQTRMTAERHTNPVNRNTSRDSASIPVPAVNPHGLLERELLRSVLHDPSSAALVAAELGDAPFQAEAYNMCFQAVLRREQGDALQATMNNMLGSDAHGMQTGESRVTWQECVARLRLEHMREELEVMEEGLTTLADRNPAHYIMHICDSLMAFRRWRRAMHQISGRPQAS